MPTPPNKTEVEGLVDKFAALSRAHIQNRLDDGRSRESLDMGIDEVIAAAAIFCAMSVSKVPTDKVRRLDDFNAQFRAQLAAEIVSGFQPFTL